MFIKTDVDYLCDQRLNVLVLQEIIIMTASGTKKKLKLTIHEVKNNWQNSID